MAKTAVPPQRRIDGLVEDVSRPSNQPAYGNTPCESASDWGHLDTDPSQGDLFDPKYKVAPLTLPQSLADSQGVLP